MDGHDVLIIGAGPGGLACAAALRERGIAATVLERHGQVGETWRRRPDGLRLNSGRGISALPGQRYPRGVRTFPRRDDVVGYLARYAEGLAVRTGVVAERIDPDGAGGWVARTSAGLLQAHHVIVATGQFNRPVHPTWPGRPTFAGAVLHAGEYRSPEPFRGRDVLVVGSGCSGVEIATELQRDGARRVLLSVRTSPNFMPLFFGALPGVTLMLRLPTRLADAQARLIQALTIGDLSTYGLPRPTAGPFTLLAREGREPTPVARRTLQAIRSGRIPIVPAVADLDRTGAQLADGTHVRVDAVIAATGFAPDLHPLIGHLDVLDPCGRPVPRSAWPPGLHFIGFDRLPGQLVFFTQLARQIAGQIAARPTTPAVAG